MYSTFPRPGDWVSFYSKSDRCPLIGFVVNKSSGPQRCLVFVPLRKKNYSCPISVLVEEEPSLDADDIHALIDLSLDLGDKDWFIELTKRLR